DMVRRVLRGALDANMEQPELRKFKGNPVKTVLANRGTYIAAVLTIVRAYLAADCPGLLAPLNSFDDWSRLVRSPLVWLGYADPVKSIEAARTDDPTRAELRAVVAAWHDVLASLTDPTNKVMTAGDLKRHAGTSIDTDSSLYKALLDIAPTRGRTDEV